MNTQENSIIPNIVLLGRQNTGKSTLFNIFSNKRSRNIISSEPGTTRDCVSSLMTIQNDNKTLYSYIWDLPGFDFHTNKENNTLNLSQTTCKKIQQNINRTIECADLILYLLDKNGAHREDELMIEKFRKKSSQSVIYVINKLDHFEQEEALAIAEYGRFHLQKVIGVSCRGRWQLSKLQQWINQYLLNCKQDKNAAKVNIVKKTTNDNQQTKVASLPTSIAIIGKPNSGKSSIYNCLAKNYFSLVDSHRNTTRDIVQDTIKFQNNNLTLIDTAGLRKIARMQRIDYYAALRTLCNIRDADLIWFIMSCNEKDNFDRSVNSLDRRIFNYIRKMGKPFIVLINKNDLLTSEKLKRDFKDNLNYIFPENRQFPLYYVSAHKNYGLEKILKQSLILHELSKKRISTRELQNCLSEWKKLSFISKLTNNKNSIKFIVQSQENLPQFVIFYQSSKKQKKYQLARMFQKLLQEKFYALGVTVQVLFKETS